MTDGSARRDRREWLWLGLLWVWLLAGSLSRPLLPIDETRYASVAWEMWTRGDFLLPVLNGEPYHHKPPLLFWLMHAGWALFGVGDIWPRLISPLFAAGTLVLTVVLARQLWPARPEVARMAPFVLLSSLLFSYLATALMFDVMLSFFVMLGFVGLVLAGRSAESGRRRALAGGFGLLTLGLAGALYAKGPVALLHLLPPALLAPLWLRAGPRSWRAWYAGVALSLLAAAALILAWALPAAMAGGETYRNAIFWGQTAGRMSESFAHRAPPWFYLVSLPVMLAPWLLWPRWWQGLGADGPPLRAETGWRLAVLGCGLCLLAFSLISGKRWQYLLPEFPLFALIVARALAVRADPRPPGRWALAVPALTVGLIALGAFAAAPLLAGRMAVPADGHWLAAGGGLALAAALGLAACRPTDAARDVRRIAVASVIATSSVFLCAERALRESYDVVAVGQLLSRHEAAGRPVAVAGAHHGQWTFAGRLPRPPQTIDNDELPAWLAANPQGRVVYVYRLQAPLPPGTRAEFTQPYRGGWLAVLAAG